MQSLAALSGLSGDDFMEKVMDLKDSTTADALYVMILARRENDPQTSRLLNSTGRIFWRRYYAGHRATDLERAISSYDKSVRLTPDFDQEQGIRLSDLGAALESRFENRGDLSDSEAACFCFEGSLLSEPRGTRACRLMGSLGCAYLQRALRTGDRAALAQAITVLQQAVDLSPDGHPDKPSHFNNLGSAFKTRFDRLGDVTDLEMAISLRRKAVDLTPDGDPDKPGQLNNLGLALEARFRRLGDVADLETVVALNQEAVDRTPKGHPNKPRFLSSLGLAFQTRFDRHGDLTDLEKAVFVTQKAINLTPNGHPDKPGHLNNLGIAFKARFDRLGDLIDLERAISVEQKAANLIPDGHPEKPSCLSNLGLAFQTRFRRLGDVADVDMAVSVKQKAVDLTPDGHPDKPGYLNNLGSAFKARFDRLGDVTDLDMAVSIRRKVADVTPDGHPDKPMYLNNLGLALQKRFDRLGDLTDLEMAVSVTQRAVTLNPDDHPDKPGHLNNLGRAFKTRFYHLGDVADLVMAVSVTQKAVGLTPDGHPDKPRYLNGLSIAFRTRFGRLGDASDLQSAIAAIQRCVDSTPDGHIDKPTYLGSLAQALTQRYRLYSSPEDLQAAINMISTAAQSISGVPRMQLQAAQEWARLTEMLHDEQQSLCAYDCAIALIPRVAWMGLAIEGRHRELEQIGELVRNAAAAAVRSGDPDRALQWLEQGRSVVWGQSLQQRSPVDTLRERDPIRADRLAEISRDLEFNAKDIESSAEARGKERRSLVLEWDALVSEVRKLDGFDDFLGPKKVSQLLTAASSCPIVVLNAHEAGCDALILMADADAVIHIPLGLTSRRAQELVNTLETVKSQHSRGRSAEPTDRGFRIVGSDNHDPEKMIDSMLAELWTSIVKPVLDGLAVSLPDNDYDDLPRICWCPTGLVAFLPIHAAGLFDTGERGTKVFDFVVSSYTPTVSALLQAPSPIPTVPRIFAVAQAQETSRGFSALPSTSKEIWLLGQRAEINSIGYVVAQDGAGTVKRVLDEMTKCNWVHLACHGTQDLDDPKKSAFILADGDLELSEIIKHSLPHAEFAFLSACQTATGDVKLAEEAVHLAAGMMLAGYRSVIATMWSILDKDGPVVADDVYAEMLKDGKADYTRAAYALHRAIQKLRLSGAPFMAWMPFIHMGR